MAPALLIDISLSQIEAIADCFVMDHEPDFSQYKKRLKNLKGRNEIADQYISQAIFEIRCVEFLSRKPNFSAVNRMAA